MTHVVLGLGSNINREKNIRFAVKQIGDRYGEIEISPIYETAAIGFDGPAFFNLVLGFKTSSSLLDIRDKLRNIETAAGRIRGRQSFDNRHLDIDVELFGDKNLRPDGLNIPSDEIEKYAYVLKPLSDLYPTLAHPVSGVKFEQMWLDFDSTQKLGVANFSL
ncbi:2-amino-4-hydroxy-6-hydroxymethyldihydropteridine diphosphokinase [Candidatus Spongiihabitans sp.]|uniref:2-amino-4-hydroxy-6- hydroxymethyldihydropteridine diphosphokinase n=1 Tax=Candidatus Spongiihabitans sp. TaxID=3101308 RepID=UPI003C7041F0